MTEKELDSMTTVQMKPEYAASEVYSTASEPPPAYKRKSSSVQIAKIVAFTVIASSFIIGCFILASAYLQARASCDQMQALDSVLEKELMLETLQQVNKEIPRAEALIGKENDDMDLQNIDREEPSKKEDPKQESSTAAPAPVNENDVEQDSSFSENDETDDLQKPHMKVPFELDLSDLVAALLENNHKSRMNCVVERKQAEELVDSPSRTMQLPFGLNLTTDPKKARITGERIAIFCENGNENEKRTEDAEPIRPMFIPFQRLPIPFGPQPQQIPLTHMPQSMPPQPMIHQMPPPFQQIPIRPPIPLQVMQAPRPEPQPQIRVQVQRVPIREIHLVRLPMPIPNGNENPEIQIQRIPNNEIPQIHIQRIPNGEPREIHIQRIPNPELPIPRIPTPEMPMQRFPNPEISIQRIPNPEISIQRIPNPEISIQRIPNPEFEQMQPQRFPNPETPEFRIQRVEEVPQIHIQRIPQPEVMPPNQFQRIPNNEETHQIHIQPIFTTKETPQVQIQRNPNPEEMPQLQQIHLQRVPNNEEGPQIQVQRLPFGEALERVGITADDLKNIQRIAEDRITEELRRLSSEDSSSSNSESSESSSEDDDESNSKTEEKSPKSDQSAESLQTMQPPSPMQQLMQMERAMFGRSLVNPIHIPVPMMQSQESSQESSESERPHYVQPRSIRVTEDASS